jgi:hypothetical protein
MVNFTDPSRPHGRISFGFGYDSYELDRLKTWGWTAVEMGRYTKDTSQAGKLWENLGKTMGPTGKPWDILINGALSGWWFGTFGLFFPCSWE